MPTLQVLAIVAATGLGFSLSPGPSMFYVLSRGLGQSRQAGLASALGLAMGGMMLAVFTAIGAGAVLSDSGTLFSAVKLAGGVYLLYLGFRSLYEIRSYGRTTIVASQSTEPFARIVRQGVLVELLNPKTVLFFLAFLPQFVDQDAGNIGLQMLVLGLLIPLTAIPADVTVSLAAGSLAEQFKRNPRFGVTLELLSIVILIGLGIRVLVSI